MKITNDTIRDLRFAKDPLGTRLGGRDSLSLDLSGDARYTVINVSANTVCARIVQVLHEDYYHEGELVVVDVYRGADYTEATAFAYSREEGRIYHFHVEHGFDEEKDYYEVVVGNIGTAHIGHSRAAAESIYSDYVEQSTSMCGRAGGESVTMLLNEVIIAEFIGVQDREVEK